MNSRRVTSQDVAEHAGVSRTTVSLVLNNVKGVHISEETRQRVIQAAEELGYVPEAAAQALASGRSKFIGLVLTRRPHHVATDAFLTQILNPLIEMARQNNLRLLLDIVEEMHHRETYLRLVRGRRIDGIIISGPRLNDQGLEALEEEGFPTVLMGRLPDSSFYCVDVDNGAALLRARPAGGFGQGITAGNCSLHAKPVRHIGPCAILGLETPPRTAAEHLLVTTFACARNCNALSMLPHFELQLRSA